MTDVCASCSMASAVLVPNWFAERGCQGIGDTGGSRSNVDMVSSPCRAKTGEGGDWATLAMTSGRTANDLPA